MTSSIHLKSLDKLRITNHLDTLFRICQFNGVVASANNYHCHFCYNYYEYLEQLISLANTI